MVSHRHMGDNIALFSIGQSSQKAREIPQQGVARAPLPLSLMLHGLDESAVILMKEKSFN